MSAWGAVDLFLGALSMEDDRIIHMVNSNYANVNETDTCQNQLIDEKRFYQLSLIPAALIVLVFCLTQKRRHLALDLLHGRPGLVFPLDITSRSNRFSHACAFGSTAALLIECIFHDFRAFDYEGPLVMKTVVILASVLIFGVVYFPVFACLTIGSVYGYGLGAAYVWMLTAVQVVKLCQCEYLRETRIIIVTRNIPQLLCLFYLSFSIPIRFFRECTEKQFTVQAIERQYGGESLEEIMSSYQGKHLRELLRPKYREKEDLEEKSLLQKMTESFFDLTYRREPGFRYSAMLLSTLMVASSVLYSVAFEAFAFIISYYRYSQHLLNVYTRFQLALLTTPEQKELYNLLLDFYATVVDYITAAVLAGLCMSSVLGAYSIVRLLVGYRTTMHRLYRGEMKEQTKALSRTSLLVGGLKFCGFQVTYIFWGFFIHSALFILLCALLATLILLISYNITDWLTGTLLQLWPIPVWTIVIYIAQNLLAEYVFLQKDKKQIAFTNRRALFIFSYFMFFYNVFLGIFSTLLRLVKSVFIGAIIISRLDHSVLPAAFVGSDPGYQAYVGFMAVEVSQTHPVMIVFLKLLLLAARHRSRGQAQLSHVHICSHDNDNDSIESTDTRKDVEKKRRYAAFQWHLFYTLINNPDLRLHRKGFIQSTRRAQSLGIRIPVSDGIVVFDPEFLKQLEEQEEADEPKNVLSKAGEMVERKAAAFKVKFLSKAKKWTDSSCVYTMNSHQNGGAVELGLRRMINPSTAVTNVRV